jgi:hypothetical protein
VTDHDIQRGIDLLLYGEHFDYDEVYEGAPMGTPMELVRKVCLDPTRVTMSRRGAQLPPSRLLVIAHDARDWEQWCGEKGISKGRTAYVSGVTATRGYRQLPFVTTERAPGRSDFHELVRMLEEHGDCFNLGRWPFHLAIELLELFKVTPTLSDHLDTTGRP